MWVFVSVCVEVFASVFMFPSDTGESHGGRPHRTRPRRPRRSVTPLQEFCLQTSGRPQGECLMWMVT